MGGARDGAEHDEVQNWRSEKEREGEAGEVGLARSPSSELEDLGLGRARARLDCLSLTTFARARLGGRLGRLHTRLLVI